MNEEELPVKDIMLNNEGQPELEERLIGVSDIIDLNSSFSSCIDYEA